MYVCLFVCLLHDASGHSNVLKAGKAEELKTARKRRTARKADKLRVCPKAARTAQAKATSLARGQAGSGSATTQAKSLHKRRQREGSYALAHICGRLIILLFGVRVTATFAA